MDNTNIALPLLDVNSAHCALRVEKALHGVPTLEEARVDLDRHLATLRSATSAQAVREAVAAIRKAGYNVATERHRFSTTGITCAGCANKAGDILNKLPGVVSATADHVTRTADVEVVQGTLTQEDLLNALRPAGYGLLPVAA
ncbi:MAG: cation transporter [Flavobacteriales bacterium]|nr:MAG: cation transporter [Flavobacteriales bacterium]